MSDMSFVINYTKTKASPPARAIQYEKRCLTKNAALNFCVELTELGGRALELVQLIQGREDAVLDGNDLDRAIDRQRARLGTDLCASWK